MLSLRKSFQSNIVTGQPFSLREAAKKRGMENNVSLRVLLETMRRYTFSLDQFTINKTRARHNDTDYVTAFLQVGDNTYPIENRFMGDLNDGSYGIGISFEDILVSDIDTRVVFNFQIVNSGHSSESEIYGILGNAASSLASTGATALGDSIIPGTGSIWGVAAKYITNSIVNILDANCDGIVAADQIVVNGATLASWTEQGQHTENRFYPGIDSNTGCGDNSEYYVQFSIKHGVFHS